MIGAFLKAFAQLSDPAMRRYVWIGLAAAAAVFAVLWTLVWYLLASLMFFHIGWLEWLLDTSIVVVAVVLTWVLFPGVAGLVITLLLEGVAGAVEARHYAHLGPAAGPSVASGLIVTLRFLGILVVLNVFLLVFLLLPPLFPFVFYGVNGYLLGREYFELVALRRAGRAQVKALRKARRGRMTLAGVVIALLMTIPVVNLLTPIVATAAMVHLFQAWRDQGEG